jgi:hypothetical protein
MKTERRHELQTNQLADWIGHQFDHMKPHGKTILAAGILGAAVIVAAWVILADRQAERESAWTEFHVALGARDSLALADVAKRHAGTEVALWARQAQADLDLNRGIAALYTNRDDATFALRDSRKGYTDVIAEATSHPELMQHSLFGLGQAQEASGNLDGARDSYQQVVQQFPNSAVAKEAGGRLTAIKDPEVAKWYSWFSKQKPRPSSQFSMPSIPGLPDDLTKLPDKPDLPPAPEGGVVTPATDASATPAPAAATPAPSAPADAASKESGEGAKPVEPSKPSEPAKEPASPESPPKSN